MTEGDARFADANARALRLKAMDADDLTVISALSQDAVFVGSDMAYEADRRRFAILINRFRWEDKRSEPERVRSVLTVDNALSVSTRGIDRGDGDMVYSLLSISFEPGEDGTGRVVLTLAGDGDLAIEVEALEVTLQDVTRPYLAPSGKAPRHET